MMKPEALHQRVRDLEALIATQEREAGAAAEAAALAELRALHARKVLYELRELHDQAVELLAGRATEPEAL